MTTCQWVAAPKYERRCEGPFPASIDAARSPRYPPPRQQEFGSIYTKQVLKLSGFALVIVGTVGLLVTEFAVDWGDDGSRPFTLAFAAANALGLAALAVAHWGVKPRAG
jgi:hypothetical protein